MLEKFIKKIYKIKNKFIHKTISHIINKFCYSSKSDIKNRLYRVANVASPVLAIIVLVITINFFVSRDYGLNLEYNGSTICTVQNEEIFEKAAVNITENLSSEASEKVDLNLRPEYTLIPVGKNEYANTNDVKNKIVENSNVEIEEATALYVNGELKGCAKDEDTIKDNLNKLLDDMQQKTDGKVSFADDISIETGLYPTYNVKTDEEIKNIINYKNIENNKYFVNQGDTIDLIAKKNVVKVDLLKELNPKLSSERQPAKGEVINITKEIPTLATMQYTYEEGYEAVIPHEVVQTFDDNEYTEFELVTQNGSDGLAKKLDNVTYINGCEISRDNLNNDVLVQPKAENVTVGTKQIPNKGSFPQKEGTGVSTGKFMWPVLFTRNITSPFGPRWGTFHKGIDISSPGVNGQIIVASDGGVVIQSTNSGNGYGNCVIIKHGGQYSTLYGHCGSIYVKAGQKVSKGQPIASVGSTGDSTGPHLHFEVRINDEQVDPQDYLDK